MSSTISHAFGCKSYIMQQQDEKKNSIKNKIMMPSYEYTFNLSNEGHNKKIMMDLQSSFSKLSSLLPKSDFPLTSSSSLLSLLKLNNLITNYIEYFTLIIRYYDYYGDGTENGWMQSISTPIISIDNIEIPDNFYYWLFNYNNSFEYGNSLFGFDQYAQYLTLNLSKFNLYDDSIIKVTGKFQQVSYMSITLQKNIILYLNNNSTLGVSLYADTILDYEVKTIINDDNNDDDNVDDRDDDDDNVDDNVYETVKIDENNTHQLLNPYIVGNPSVMSYVAPTQSSHDHHKDDGLNNVLSSIYQHNYHDNNDYNHQQQHKNDSINGYIPVYRVDHTSSTLFSTDDIAEDGCSRCYLYAKKSTTRNDEIIILRMNLPTTFFDDYSPDKIFNSYQTRYFSVSSAIANTDTNTSSDNTDFIHLDHHYQSRDRDHQKEITNDKDKRSSSTSLSSLSNKKSPLYYGVNSRLVKPYIDDLGYFYVFFAPNDFTMNLALEQGLGEDSLIPPVMSWGQYKGYVLGKM